MRPETPLIISPQANSALEIIKILAIDQKIKTYCYEENYDFVMDEDDGSFDFYWRDSNEKNSTEKNILNLPKPSLPGSHQYFNFATALATIFAVQNHHAHLFQINEDHIKSAIKSTKWPSRLEKITNGLEKFLENSQSEIWIDGAHNEGGALALAKWLLEKKNEDEEKKFNFVITGFSRGKCKKEFLSKFQNIAQIIAVKVDGEPYPESPEIIAQIGESINLDIYPAEDLLSAIFHIKKSCANKPCRIVICGSLHLARDVKKFGTIGLQK
jgi:dihydrofolate synthase/folylpolyglutamate synthase